MKNPQMANESIQKAITNIKNHVPHPRVGQLDASILDSELLELLKSQLWKVFKTFRPDIKDSYEGELLLFLKLVIFKLTVWDNSATYGAKLQNLVFVDGRGKSASSSRKPLSKAQKIGYGVLVVGGSYLWSKLEEKVSEISYNNNNNNTRSNNERRDNESEYNSRSQGGNRRWRKISPQITFSRIFTVALLRKLIDTFTYIWSASSLFNFIAFLYSGRYSTLILRLLGIRIVPSTRSLTRQISFEFQNRQLVWNAFTEFLVFIVPLLNLPRLKRRMTKLISSLNTQYYSSSYSEEESGNKDTEKKGELYFLPEKTCAICYKGGGSARNGGGNSGGAGGEGGATAASSSSFNTEITNPCKSVQCGHIYCYVCLSTKLLENEGDGWPCLRCNTIIYKMRPFEEVNLNAIKINNAVFREVEIKEEEKVQAQEIVSGNIIKDNSKFDGVKEDDIDDDEEEEDEDEIVSLDEEVDKDDSASLKSISESESDSEDEEEDEDEEEEESGIDSEEYRDSEEDDGNIHSSDDESD